MKKLKKIFDFFQKLIVKHWVVLVIFLVSFGLYFWAGLFWQPKQRPTGDEPHYLIITQSIIEDHDLNLKNNYDDKTYKIFGYWAENLDKHISPRSTFGKEYSIHNIGWPIIMVPGFYFGGRSGVMITVELLASLLSVNIFLLIRKVLQNDKNSIITWAAVAFSVPIVTYAFQSFSEIAAALLIIYAARKIWEQRTFSSEIFLILALGYLPWIHIKYLGASCVLILFWLFMKYTKRKLFFLGIFIVALIGLSCFFKASYGSFLPNAQYPSEFGLKMSNILVGSAGLFFDKALGIIPYAPVYLLTIAGLFFVFKYEKRFFVLVLSAFLSVFLIQAAAIANLGWAPIGRFLVPIIGLLAPAIGLVYQRGSQWVKFFFWNLTFVGWLIGYIFITHPDLNYSLDEPKLINALSPMAVRLADYFPRIINFNDFQNVSHRDLIVLFIWLAITLIINVIIIIQSVFYQTAKHRSHQQ